ncbi:MAG: KOW domain-containing RNA-binding protein [Clostridiales bacterium]|nr:KOW domain-containing RNA-binding protein [Clostridiales bacterium]MCF8022407.1 KOW domain-containing RNA-binding protein [Clostridiales bacterium]
MQRDIVPGQLVKSVAGRDKGQYFLVIEIQEDKMMVADGDMRKVQNLKKKNIKHLKNYNLVAQDIAQKLTTGKGPTNGEVNKAVKDLVVGLEG